MGDWAEGPGGRWWSRGYMPHFDSAEVVQHVTFHLADGLPLAVLRRFEDELVSLAPKWQATERHRRVQAWLDGGAGDCLLRSAEAASLVESALLHFDCVRYRLLAWVVMPNHVHAVLQTTPEWSLSKVVWSWKSYTGRRLAPGRQVWARDCWDRYVRNEEHLATVLRYVHENPVKAGLVERAEDWPWSSAGRHAQ